MANISVTVNGPTSMSMEAVSVPKNEQVTITWSLADGLSWSNPAIGCSAQSDSGLNTMSGLNFGWTGSGPSQFWISYQNSNTASGTVSITYYAYVSGTVNGEDHYTGGGGDPVIENQGTGGPATIPLYDKDLD